MEVNDEIVERQKLVPNDVEIEEEPTNNQLNTAPKSTQTPTSSPSVIAVPKINIKSISSGETTRSRNSATCSIERTTSDKQTSSTAKVSYVNERRPKHAGDERFEFKSRPRKLLKDVNVDVDVNVDEDNIVNKTLDENVQQKQKQQQQQKQKEQLNNKNNSYNNNNNKSTTAIATSSTASSTAQRRKLSNGYLELSIRSNNSNNNTNNNNNNNNNNSKNNNANTNVNSDKFDDRPIKHHSFVSEVPDVKHMERALLGLLDDFHSGKLKAFGASSMEQMTKIREQQESLAKLHFELAAAEEDSLENGNDLNAAKAQENMLQLVQRLEQLSISIEQLQTSHTGGL